MSEIIKVKQIQKKIIHESFTPTKGAVIYLNPYYDLNNDIEVGVDEVSRETLFSRVYVAGVVLPKDDSFLHNTMKDSKKIHSKQKMSELA